MKDITAIAIDTAKQTFYLVGFSRTGKAEGRRKLGFAVGDSSYGTVLLQAEADNRYLGRASHHLPAHLKRQRILHRSLAKDRNHYPILSGL